MPTTPYVKPMGEAGAGEVLVCQDLAMGKEFGMKTTNRIMSLDQAVELLGPKVVSQFIENLNWED